MSPQSIWLEVDAAIATSTRNQLLQILAALLSREAIVRALVDESAGPSSSSTVTGGSNASHIPQKR